MKLKKAMYLALGFLGLALGAVGAVLPLLPAFPFLLLAAFGFEGDTLSELVDNAVEKAQQAGETLLSAVVSTALKSAAYAVVYVVSFLLLLLLLRLVLTPLHLFTKLPVVHGVNALLGGVLGLVKCALLLFLAVWVLQKLQLLVTPELVSKTVLLKFFAQNSPIDLIAKL